METMGIDREWVDERTTLEMALMVYDKDKFLAVKREFLDSEFDEDVQTKIWEDYHDLFRKAVVGRFEEGDNDRLDYYCRLEGQVEILSYGSMRMYFPTHYQRDASGNIIVGDRSFLDDEITKRWFGHIYDILTGRADVRMCSGEDCSNFFIRTRRKDRKFCGNTCRNRVWRKSKKKL